MRKGVSESDGSGSSHHQPHYASLGTHIQHHPHSQEQHQHLVMHNLQSSQVCVASTLDIPGYFQRITFLFSKIITCTSRENYVF